MSILTRKNETYCYNITRRMSAAIYEGIYRVEYYGMHNVPQSGGYLIAVNHVSYFDPPLAGASLPRPMYYFARKTLLSNPFGRWLFPRLYTIPVDRDGPGDPGALKRVLGLIKGGNGLLVFPEGTRSLDGKLGEAKPGAGLLACMTGVPVIPCHLIGVHDIWRRGTAFPRLDGRLHVIYGAPITKAEYCPPGMDKREAYEHASRLMLERLAALRPPLDAGL